LFVHLFSCVLVKKNWCSSGLVELLLVFHDLKATFSYMFFETCHVWFPYTSGIPFHFFTCLSLKEWILTFFFSLMFLYHPLSLNHLIPRKKLQMTKPNRCWTFGALISDLPDFVHTKSVWRFLRSSVYHSSVSTMVL
jgi:hypothetical protein